MTSLKEEFDFAVNQVRTFPPNDIEGPTNEERLKMYGLYKQAVFGDCNTTKPGVFNLKERAKWSAWQDEKGKKKETAMTEYCSEFLNLCDKYKY